MRYAEADAQAIVFNSHYLVWCDEAMMAFLGANGIDYASLEASGVGPRLVATELAWSSSARWGDVVEVDVALERVGRTSLVLAFAVRVGERAVCRVRTTYVMTDPAGTPRPVPDEFRALPGSLSGTTP